MSDLEPTQGHGSVRAQGPVEESPAGVTEAKDAAGGIPAVVSSMRHIQEETGLARGVKTLLRMNQSDGFDCPGCAWPDPDDKRAVTEFCENGAKAVAEEATTRRVTAEFFQKWSVAALSEQTDHWLGKQGRLTHPMVLRPGSAHYEPISWDDAFQLIASELNALTSPDEALFYTSGRTSNEAAFLYQLFVRQFGSNNLPDCSNMCHESSGAALNETIGVGKGTVTLEDLEIADTIFVIGQNPGTNHPRMLTALQHAVRRGCTIVSVNPLPEAGLMRFQHPQEPIGMLTGGTPLTKLFLQVRINGDVALLKGVIKEMLEAEERRPGTVIDHEFIAAHTSGYEEFAVDILAESWDTIVEQSGVGRDQIREAAEIAMRAERMICCWAMGLTQHKNAVANIQEIVNLLLLRGQIGKPGAGACPVRGHSNVQGDRTMGIWEKMPDRFLDALGREFDFDPPRQHGLDAVESIKAMHAGKARVFIGMGGNFLSATPDTEYTADALRRCQLTVQISTKLNRSHLVTGQAALILPCLGRTETDLQAGGPQFVTVEDSMSVVHRSRGTLPPASEHLRSEPAIVAGMARATLGARSKVGWDELIANYDSIRDHIARVIPGFQDYNSRVRGANGFRLPNGARERSFVTTTQKARFTVHPIPTTKLGSDELLMMTIRSHDQYNTTIYGLDDRYRGVRNGRRVVFLNAEDIHSLGFQAEEWVDLVGRHEGVERVAERFMIVPYDIPRGCAATYFPETNVLVPITSVADKSNTPTSKSVIIRLRRSIKS
ncbi:hypothetical protein CCAX7_46830 [Capsulimonas corticalis]|uniref:Uncharacterized protein n=1 Tax=Capsulimonas corticalis TaxID=2219043 RepID=A0A402CQK8_9BACT|nr:FdhF/YdeP family oxidoreductase [Capsulimonas corticalis]BDI32632.1 hypothetical protein CCAX7_46830 [Capsulimonas corticalis]